MEEDVAAEISNDWDRFMGLVKQRADMAVRIACKTEKRCNVTKHQLNCTRLLNLLTNDVYVLNCVVNYSDDVIIKT